SPPVTRQALVSIQAGEDGSFSITVRVNKITGAETKREVVGRDAELERTILRRLKAQQVAKEQPPPGPPKGSTEAAEGKNRLEDRTDGKQAQVRGVLGDEVLQAVADRMSYDEAGLLVLEGNVRMRKTRGKKVEDIHCQKMVIDRKAGAVKVDGSG